MSGLFEPRPPRAPSTDTQLDIQSISVIPAPPPSVSSELSGGPRYEILEKLHRGGMGEIHLAQLTTPSGFSRRVVLKGLLSPRTDDIVSEALFMREAHLMARLDHPNTVRVFDLPLIDGRPYLAMELVRGRNLHDVIERSATLGRTPKGIPATIALTVVSEALRGLHSAHCLRGTDGASLGLVHRDVTPGNILLSFCGEVKVTDFGIAKLADSPKYTSPRSIRGKARYVAPEQVHGEPATVASDIYSAGVVLAEALMGEPLWERSSIAETLMAIVTEDRTEVLERVLRGLPKIDGLRSTLQSVLATEPKDRPTSALHFAEILEAIADLEGRRPSSVDLGMYLRELFADSPDIPDDGFGRSGERVELHPDPIEPHRGGQLQLISAPRAFLTPEPALTKRSPPPPPPASSALLVPPLSDGEGDTPTPLIMPATAFAAVDVPERSAVFTDPAEPALPFDAHGSKEQCMKEGSASAPEEPPRDAEPPARADPAPPTTWQNLGMLVVGIFVGASLAIAGCLVALTSNP